MWIANRVNWPSDVHPGHGLPIIAKIEGVGSDLPEIVERFYGVREDICLAINRKAGLPDEPQHSLSGETAYFYTSSFDITAALASTDSYTLGDDFPDLIGAHTFCTIWTASPRRWFLWHVVKAR